MKRSPFRLCSLVCAALSLCAAQAWARADAASGAGSDQPAEVRGQLTIHAEQGTPGGPAIGPCDAEIELHHRGGVIATMTARLDESGAGVVESIPVTAGVIPVVKIRHADVFYLQSGEPMDAEHPSGEITVTCYEVTTQEPAWSILVRHAMLVSDPHGVRVTEIVQIRSDGDRTWLGTPHAAGVPITTSFTLPASATDIQLMQGFNGWEDTSHVGTTLYNHLPLMPGDTEMTLTYMIESHRSEVSLAFSAPVLTQHAMLIVPTNISVARTSNVVVGGETRVADTDVHYYMAQGLAPGAEFGLTVSSLAAQPAAPSMASYEGPPSDGPRTGSMMKWIAAAGGALILLAAGVLLVFRRGTAGP